MHSTENTEATGPSAFLGIHCSLLAALHLRCSTMCSDTLPKPPLHPALYPTPHSSVVQMVCIQPTLNPWKEWHARAVQAWAPSLVRGHLGMCVWVCVRVWWHLMTLH